MWLSPSFIDVCGYIVVVDGEISLEDPIIPVERFVFSAFD
jgi:hypothetical protein